MSSFPDKHDARYPPIMKRFPATQISSMSSTAAATTAAPLYSGVPNIASAVGVISPATRVPRSTSVPVVPAAVVSVNGSDGKPRALSMVDTKVSNAADSSAAVALTSSRQATSRSSALSSRAKFCRWDVIGCINCTDSSSSDVNSMVLAPTDSGGARAASVSRKAGPLLLDLRRLDLNTSPSIENEANEDENAGSPMFKMTTICQSRGNPSLGTSVASTCLDFCKLLTVAETNDRYVPPCATGLTTGALCIHSFSGNVDDDIDRLSPSIEYYHMPRHHRPATVVAWRPHSPSHVAVGYGYAATSGTSSSHAAGGTLHSMMSTSPTTMLGGGSSNADRSRRLNTTSAGPSSSTASGIGAANPNAAGDRDYCCFIWDIEHQSSSQLQSLTAATAAGTRNRTQSSPLYKLSHAFGVASLGWILEGGQTLVVGGQHRNLQFYDLRTSPATAATTTTLVQAAASSPVTVFGHATGVHAIEVDPIRSSVFATYSRAAGEPVKLWDARHMDAPLTEIKLGGGGTTAGSSDAPTAATYTAHSSLYRTSSALAVTSVQWSTYTPGLLFILIGDSLYEYNTLTSSARPTHVQTTRMGKALLDFANYPFGVGNMQRDSQNESAYKKAVAFTELLPKRILAVDFDQSVHIAAAHHISPIAVSPRTGQVIHVLGRTMLTTVTSVGAIEDPGSPEEDVSAVMWRRARCLHVSKYSMDATSNIKLLTNELSPVVDGPQSPSRTLITEEQLRLWKWIRRVEGLCAESVDDTLDSVLNWPAKNIMDSGVVKLLELDDASPEQHRRSDTLSCTIYDSQGRRAAMAACGWAGLFDLENVMSDCESRGEYERSAALALWYGDIEAAVDALQRAITAQLSPSNSSHAMSVPNNETLELVAFSIAGYRPGDSNTAMSGVWRKACANLLRRPDLSNPSLMPRGANYLRHILVFLMTIGIDDAHKQVMEDKTLSLCDRVAFGCRFLDGSQLKFFLDECVMECINKGSIEGIAITGMEKQGIQILQSYVDRYSDVQTATLVTSRVIFPADWMMERRIAAEWLHAYRSLLNRWQMWQSRAMFDVDRADLLRGVKARLYIDMPGNLNGPSGSRRGVSVGRRPGARSQVDPDVQAAVPAQLDARCNYCSSSLVLRRKQDGQPNQWLSKMKSVLQCCPQCRKPLPRCAVCMLSLGALNPYMELTKERPRMGPRGPYGSATPTGSTSMSQTMPLPDDLSSLANLPFAEWFSWCLRCKHGGHAHHMVGWFAKHEVCPVSGCNCKCQFDGISKLQRPSVPPESLSKP